MRTPLLTILLTTCVAFSALVAAQSSAPEQAKPASKFTAEANRQAKAQLAMQDRRDLEEARRGFVAAPDYKQIKGAKGNIVWDIGRYDFLLKDKTQDQSPDSVHPSLWHQAQANMGYGLFEVVPGRIWQLRGFDIANMTLVKGDTGWIIVDTMTTTETASAALAFANEKLGKRPVVAVVYSHSHADHFGGVRGVVDEADVKAGKVAIIAPVGFMDHAASEWIYAGNAMVRRFQYQYGSFLPHNEHGHVDQAIGKTTPVGTVTLIAPTRVITKDLEEVTVDGVKMVFQNTPGTEAPAEMNTWFPQFKAFWSAENITGTIHNVYTLRGAQTRDALYWSKSINDALYKFGSEAEVIFASHNWPRWGNARVQEVMRTQRDTYAHLNNWSLHLANSGVTINEMHNVYKLPASLQKQWAARSYHGSEEHNSRAIVNRLLGYWDANPATLTPLSPRDSAPLYVSMMGGSDKIIAKGRELNAAGKYSMAVEILNKLVFAEPTNQAAKNVLADAYEQIGYQKESTSLRNSYLMGALELRGGIPQAPAPAVGADMLRALTTEHLLDAAAINLNSDKAQAQGLAFVMNLVMPDTQEKLVVELSNGALTHMSGHQAKTPDLTLTLPRALLLPVLAGVMPLDKLVADGKAKLDGKGALLTQTLGLMVRHTPNFEILPGTKPAAR